MEDAREGERDRASSALPTLQSAGYAVGAALAGLVANAAGYTVTDTEAVRSAAVTVFAVSAAIGLLAVAAGLVLRRKLVRVKAFCRRRCRSSPLVVRSLRSMASRTMRPRPGHILRDAPPSPFAAAARLLQDEGRGMCFAVTSPTPPRYAPAAAP